MSRTIVIAGIAASCARPAVEFPRVRFANAPPVTVVDDRRNVPVKPAVSRAMVSVDYFDRGFIGPITRRFSLPQKRPARGVNALDQVPDSTWFTNRIGVRTLTPDEVGNGPLRDEGPEPHKPWTVHSTKAGSEIGFIITDATGTKYGLGFDAPEWPEIETGAHVVVNRLLWAAGYNVPADRVAYVRPEELVLAPDAEIKDQRGVGVGRLDRAGLERRLAGVWSTPDGRLRVVASRWLDGVSLGGSSPSGTRRGDPNDVIPHEHRRDLRGQYPLFAWISHTDLAETNFLDMWVTDPNDRNRRYVMHYKLDFGKSMGVMAATNRDPRIGWAYQSDSKYSNESLLTLGVRRRPWGHYFAPELMGVAPTFVVEDFDPGMWRPILPYAPFDEATPADMFWGTEIVARFTRDQIRAAVMAGRYSDPRAVEYLTNTLVGRQRATMAYWYARTNPLNRFRIDGEGLCFEDRAIAERIVPAATSHYDVTSHDVNGRLVGATTMIPASSTGATCSGPLATAGDDYTIVKVTTTRPNFQRSTFVHIARDPANGGAWRVIGIWRG